MSQYNNLDEYGEMFGEEYAKHHKRAVEYVISEGCPYYASIDLYAAKLKLRGDLGESERMSAQETIAPCMQKHILEYPYNPGDRDYTSIDRQMNYSIRVMFLHDIAVRIVGVEQPSETLQQEASGEGR